jgi:DNA modification methylase
LFFNVPYKIVPPEGYFGHVVWNKTTGFLPFLRSGVIYAHEFIWLYGDYERLKGSVTSVWSMPTQKLSKHPAPFPVALPARAISLSTNPGDLVFDPFGGSGTTAATAKAMGRNWITCDLSEQYCAWMDERIEGTKLLNDK